MASEEHQKKSEDRDESLIKEFLSGDQEAFTKLVQKYETPLLSFLVRYMGDLHEAEEVFQEVFLRVYKNTERFDLSKKFKAWVYSIAVNCARTALKRKKNDPLLARAQSTETDLSVLEGRAGEEYSPSTKHDSKEAGNLIRNAVLSLPRRQREVFLLFQYQGLSYEEIARVLGRPLGTVKSQMHYAVISLKEKLKDVVGSV